MARSTQAPTAHPRLLARLGEGVLFTRLTALGAKSGQRLRALAAGVVVELVASEGQARP